MQTEKKTATVDSIPTADNTALTEGEQIMNLSFQPNSRKDVFNIKKRCAELYDWLSLECQKTTDDIERFNRKQRLKSIALTHLETFQMNAVKAVTFTAEVLEPFPLIALKPGITEGCMVMTLDFNVGMREDVKHIKTECAKLYDDMEDQIAYRQKNFELQENAFYAKYFDDQKKAYNLLSPEEKEKVDKEKSSHHAFTNPQWSDELVLTSRKLQHAAGTMGEAMYSLKQFQMFAVKAVTR